MYILFWRVCNATSQFTFRKAMERLKKEGGERVMNWFAQLGDASTWSKHKFDPNVCNDTNTSNFVESFNSTLGIDRCRPVLTLLEGTILFPYVFFFCILYYTYMFANTKIYGYYRNQEGLYG